MISDHNVHQLAKLLVDLYGNNAAIEGEHLVDFLRQRGDPEWPRLRLRLKPAIENYRRQSGKPH